MTDACRLHYAPDNASLIIRLALEDLGTPYETVLVDRAKGGQRTPLYLALNPNGLIPVLETPDGALFETGAILLWLAERHGRLAPTPGDAARGEFLKWLFFISNTVHPCLRMTFYPDQYLGEDKGAQALLHTQMQARFADYLEMLETRAVPWFEADHPSVLDYYVACLMRWRALYPEAARGDFSTRAWPRLHAMLERLEGGGPVRAAIRLEGLGTTPFTAPAYPAPPEGSAT